MTTFVNLHTPGDSMRVLPGIDPLSPFAGGRPVLYVVGPGDDPDNYSPVALRPSAPRSIEGQTDQTEIAGPMADTMPANASLPALVDRRPPLIRGLTRLIVWIRWFPTALALLCSVPSEVGQSWRKVFGSKEE